MRRIGAFVEKDYVLKQNLNGSHNFTRTKSEGKLMRKLP